MSAKLKIAVLSMPLMLALGLVVSACGGSDLNPRVEQVEASQSEIAGQLQQANTELEELRNALTRAQLMAALDIIDSTGFHGMDEDLQQASEINPRYLGQVRKAQRVVAGTSWPAEIEDKVAEFSAALDDFETALEGNDLAAAKAAATRAHAAQHDLSNAAWPLVGGETSGEHSD